MSRTTIAAGMLPNTVGHLSGWVANSQFIKPGSAMPNLELSGPQLDVIRSYLLTHIFSLIPFRLSHQFTGYVSARHRR